MCHLSTLNSAAAGRIHLKVTVKAGSGTIRDTATVTSVAATTSVRVACTVITEFWM